jgi:hypothetical protein
LFFKPLLNHCSTTLNHAQPRSTTLNHAQPLLNYCKPLQTTANHSKLMFDPSLPATNSPLSSAEMRGQLTALNDDIQTRALSSQLAILLSETSSNSNSVAMLGMLASGSYDQFQFQELCNKVDELINALRR